VIDGRLPQLVCDVAAWPHAADLPKVDFPVGAHLSTPIVLRGGVIYGTLCCFSFAANEALAQRDLKRLRMASELVARLIDQANERAERGGS
jgi:GAF domain-containing protein